jgi:hypothetical protein
MNTMNQTNPQANKSTPSHNKAMAKIFLAGLDPSAEKFAFQVISDIDQKRSRIVHAALDEIWQVVEALNTPAKGCGIFVLPNFPTPRALIAHANNAEQIDRASAAIEACGAKVDMIIEDSGCLEICYVCSDIPLKQLPSLQKDLSAKLGTDPAVMPRVRLPGTLNLENPAAPQLVMLGRNGAAKNWKLNDLLDKLGLSLAPEPSPENLAAAPAPDRDPENPCLAARLSYAIERRWDTFPADISFDKATGKFNKKSHKSAKHSNGAKWGKTRDPEEIRKDFTKWPKANVGLPTGKDNGFWVCEADTLKGHNVDGIALLRALEKKHGALPKTLMAESPSASLHYYFNWPKGVEIKNSTSAIAPGIDVKGEGGMVIAPPSVRDDGEYRWLNNEPIADAAQWLIDLVVAASRRSGKSADKRGNDADSIKIADAFKHLDPNQNLGQGIEHRTASIEEIRAAFAVIPNDNRDWDDWNRCGLALFDATAGSDDGLVVFHAWSSKSKKYDAQVTDSRWAAYKTCPPTKIGVGSILYWANEAAPGWETLIGMPFEQAVKIATLIPLSPFDYEVKRKALAKELGMRRPALDKIVEPMRSGALDSLQLRGADAANAKQENELITKWNERHAHVLAGAKSCVLQEFKTPEGYTDFKLLSSAAFHEWYVEYKVGKKEVPVTRIWMASPERRKYQDIGFFPGRDAPGFYNLWRGFAVEPRKGDCSKFLAHIRDNVCQGNAGLYAWVMAWFADIFQHPAKKCGTSITLRGKQGVGKTKVGQVIKGLLGVHYKLVASPRYVTGQFNSHMISLLMLHADEGFWAGDKKAEGTLKDLVTGDSHPIEFKGKEAFWVDNYVRLLVGGNPDWQVPAGFEERRFAVLDVGEAHMQDHPYFAAIDAEMDAGGREALLYHLLFEVDCSKVNLRQIPHTTALLEQKLETASPEHGWWLDILGRGVLPGYRDTKAPQNEVSAQVLYDDYVEHAKKRGVPRRVIETKLGLFLRKVVGPNLRRSKREKTSSSGTFSTLSGREREPFYEFPPLSECRQAFTALLNEQQVLWEGEEGAEWGSG